MASSAPMRRWHLKRAAGGEAFGPLDAAELRLLHGKGGLSAQARLREEGAEAWVPISLVPELSDLFGSAGDDVWPFSAGAIAGFCLCTPLAGGAMWYAWKDKHPAAAAHAAKMAWLFLALWVALGCCAVFVLVGNRF